MKCVHTMFFDIRGYFEISVFEREFLTLFHFSIALYLGYAEGRVLTGLRDTFHLRIYLNQDGLLFKPTLSTGGYPTHAHHMDAFAGFHTHGFSLSQHGDTLGFLGKKDKCKYCFCLVHTYFIMISSL